MARRTLLACLALSCALLSAEARAAEPGVNAIPGQSMSAPDGAARVGAGWLRIWAVWDAVEPSAGVFSKSIIDAYNAEVAAAKARGIRVLVVVHRSPPWASGVGDLSAPPADPARFGRFMGEFARAVPGVDAWEVWNEPDEPRFFLGAPRPADYAAMLRAAYAGVKAAQPGDVVVTGGTTGNNADFVQDLYREGAGGAFDAVGVHTDTGCLTKGPDFVYRDEQGRVGRFTFTGYREVHAVMAANGDGGKPIWMTELGWSTVSAKPGSCAGVGGSRAAGVTPADQARFLTAAYRCLAADPFVGPAFWFGLQDVPGGGAGSGGGGYGLFRRGGRAKPSVRALRAVASGVAPDPRCGGRVDRVAPRLAVANPVPGLRFADQVAIDARAVDPPGGAGMRRIELWADGRKIRSFRGGRALLEPWFGSRALGLGRHTITLRALDEGLNVAEAVIGVEKVRPGALPRVATSLTMRLRSVRGRTARVAGRLARPADARVPVSGRVYAVFQKRSGGRWKTAHRVSERADRPVRVTQRVSGAGRWRVFLEYKGFAPYARSRSRPVVFSAR